MLVAGHDRGVDHKVVVIRRAVDEGVDLARLDEQHAPRPQSQFLALDDGGGPATRDQVMFNSSPDIFTDKSDGGIKTTGLEASYSGLGFFLGVTCAK